MGLASMVLFAVAACSDGVAQPRPSLQTAFAHADEVIRLDIEIAPDDAALMLVDLEVEAQRKRIDRDFEYFECTVRFQNSTYEHVGIRLKGGTSLLRPHEDGRTKLHYKLDFDKFEDEYPDTKNRTFLGQDKVNLANSFRDPTMLRELLTSELMLEFGAHAPRVRPCALYFNGVFRGLYMIIEQIDETFLRDRFGNDSGNLYKPEHPHADLTRFKQRFMVKKTNEDVADWSDVIEFIAKLKDPDVDIATIFDVDSFLPWLAVSVAICNLNSYLALPHNYYLYNNPATGLFHFISWDHNASFGTHATLGYDASNIHTYPIDVPSIPGTPLVERVLAVPEYRKRYEDLVDQLAHHPMGSDRVAPLHADMRPWALMERYPFTLMYDASDFDRSVDEAVDVPGASALTPGLLDFIEKRRAFLMDR